MRTVKYLGCCVVVVLLGCIPGSAQQTKNNQNKKTDQNKVSRLTEQLSRSRMEVVKATEDYKTSLSKLLSVYQPEINAQAERLERSKVLYSQGLIARIDLEKVEREIAELQAKVASTRKQMTECDDLIAEVEAAEKLISVPSSVYSANSTFIRYEGLGKWSIAEASKVQSFYAATFGEVLPVSAYGQSPVHDRMGFDHRNAIDVAVHPDTNEGRSLMQYLRSAGIPFLAFRHAVPGSATGAHIHIGRPSQRMTVAPAK